MNPLRFATRPVFLLPNWDHFLETVDQPASGLKRIRPMRRADGDRDADISQFEPPESMD